MKLLNNISLILISVFLFFSCNQSSTTPSSTTASEQHIKSLVSNPDLTFSEGQTVYVPAYSHIQSAYSGDKGSQITLAVTLSVRNTDIDEAIIVNSVKYYGNDGGFIKEFVETPLQLGPMGSMDFYIDRLDLSGGIGANFIVDWGAEKEVHEPYIEAIMIGAQGTLGYSWRNPGQVLDKKE